MTQKKEIKFYKVKNITQATEKDAMWCVKADNETEFKFYVTDLLGNLIALKSLSNSGETLFLTSTDESVSITGITVKDLKVSSELQALINSALQAGDNISQLINDVGYITVADIPSLVFTTDFNYNLSEGKSLGKLVGTGIYPTIGLTQEQFLRQIAIEYINPIFNFFNIPNEPTTVEVGTTLSGNKTFVWSINQNSGIILNVDLFDNTLNAMLLVNTLNDGTQIQTINTIQLNNDGATQSWKVIGKNTSPISSFDSNNFVVTSRFNKWWAAVTSRPLNSSQVRALPNSSFQTSGNSFILETGITAIKFSVNLPQGVTIFKVIDNTNLNLDITQEYLLVGTVNVLDAGGTSRIYNQYEMNVAVPYSINANHQITTT